MTSWTRSGTTTIPESGVDAHVGGSTAQQLDLAELIGERLPLIIGVVVALSMLLLMLAFRTVVAPLQAALVNLLAVGAAYGIVTAVFQEGIGRRPRSAWTARSRSCRTSR